jgi:hypothetical protein
MRFVRRLASLILPILAAGILAGCSDDSNPPTATKSPTTYDAFFRGFFVASGTVGQIQLAVSRPSPWTQAGHLGRRMLAPEGSGTGATVPVSGGLIFWGASYTQPDGQLSGTYDISTDEIQFKSGGYEFQGHFDSNTTRLTGQVTGTHTGVFDCVFNGKLEIYCGTWGKTGAPLSGGIAFMTDANHIVGGMVTRPSLQQGYLITGTIDDGDPLRAITAYGLSTDTLALGGYTDTSADTAGGWWESIPSDVNGSGWWRVNRYVAGSTADVTP